MTGLYGVPRRPPGLVGRRALLDRLADGPRLILVSAPGGSGKTSFLSEWASSDSAPDGLWVTVTADQAAGDAFWNAVVETFMDHWRSLWKDSWHPGIEHTGDSFEAVRGIIRAAERPVTLVIDEGELLTDRSVHEGLTRLLVDLPELSLVVASRHVLPLEELAAAAGIRAETLGPNELRLTAEEAREILTEEGFAAGDSIGADAAAFAGHSMLTFRYLVMGMRNRSERTPRRVDRTVFDSAVPFVLRARIGDVVDEAFREFLLSTSLADELTASLAAELSGSPDAVALLRRAENDGLGTWLEGSHVTVFRYAPVLRAGLREQLAIRHPDEECALRVRLSAWADSHHMPVVSLTQKLRGGELERAAQVVLGHWRELLDDHEVEVAELLKDLSTSDLRRYPVLAMLLGTIYNLRAINRASAVGLFGLVAESAASYLTTLEPAYRVAFLSMESAALRFTGEVAAAVDVAERTAAEIGRLKAADRQAIGDQLASLLNQVGLTFLYAGRTKHALRSFEQALRQTHERKGREAASGELGAWSAEFHSLALIAGTLALTGEITAAREVVDRIEAEGWPEGTLESYIGVTYQLARAFIALEELDFDEADRRVAVVRPFMTTIEHWGLIIHVESMVALGRDRAASSVISVEGFVRRRAPRDERSPFTAARLASTRALLFLATGKPAAASAVLDKLGGSGTEPLQLVARARVALVSDDHELVERLLSRVIEPQSGSARTRSEGTVLLAAAELALGRDERALALLERAAALLEEKGLRTPLMLMAPGDLAALRALATSQGSERARRVVGDPLVTALLPEQTTVIAPLTARERVVLRELSRSAGAADIAAALFVSPNTVKSQLRGLYRKLGVSSRDEALLLAVTLGLLVAPTE